ncbi:hypothetical protein ETH_00001480 [Eimeria tenella]|uniref:Uncharacterized protein n=1 Tax=Eimeria tenella TaxID=5802 RepID=U6L045_EIMTE|nr:hypothetical protein ETH_00001480 [Eimeria tenella]CDJ41934.1 hypothetical protein ETH_00001480 [Eimeria tenella]|eukprot:XP_013232684.1 hypothetical protein ETH_00001480 [Eimeria tenella]
MPGGGEQQQQQNRPQQQQQQNRPQQQQRQNRPQQQQQQRKRPQQQQQQQNRPQQQRNGPQQQQVQKNRPQQQQQQNRPPQQQQQNRPQQQQQHTRLLCLLCPGQSASWAAAQQLSVHPTGPPTPLHIPSLPEVPAAQNGPRRLLHSSPDPHWSLLPAPQQQQQQQQQRAVERVLAYLRAESRELVTGPVCGGVAADAAVTAAAAAAAASYVDCDGLVCVLRAPHNADSACTVESCFRGFQVYVELLALSHFQVHLGRRKGVAAECSTECVDTWRQQREGGGPAGAAAAALPLNRAAAAAAAAAAACRLFLCQSHHGAP